MLSRMNNDCVEWLDLSPAIGAVIKKSSDFLQIDYKVLQNEKHARLVPSVRVDFNGLPMMYFMPGDKRSLKRQVKELTSGDLRNVLLSLVDQARAIAENGFLRVSRVVLDESCIYIDRTTCAVQLMYLPARVEYFEDEQAFETGVCEFCLNMIDASPAAARDYGWTQTVERLRSTPSTRLSDLRMILSDPMGGDSQGRGDAGQDSGLLLRVRGGAMSGREFRVDHKGALIGRSEGCDIALPVSLLLGRQHARIVFANNTYTITDLNSKNGTFVNSTRISGYPKAVRAGDRLRLGDIEIDILKR